MDAKVDIWVGVAGGYEETMEELFDALENPWEGIEFEGYAISKFEAGDDVEGYGIGVFEHDWDCGAAVFDASEVATRIEEVKDASIRFFNKFDIDRKVDVYIQTDYR